MPFSRITASELLEAMPDANLVVDQGGIIRYANRAFLRMLGYDHGAVINQPIVNFLQDATVYDACMADVEHGGACLDHETYFLHKDGHPVHTVKNVRMLINGDMSAVLATIRDLSAVDSKYLKLEKEQTQTAKDIRHLSQVVTATEQELNTTKIQLEEILGVIDEIIWYIDDRSMEVRFVSRAVETVFGITQERFLDAPGLWKEMIYKEDRQRVLAFFERIANNSVSQTIEFRIRRGDGKVRWLNSRITHHPALGLFIGVTYDVTESKSAQDLIKFLAYHDPLTRLPNRVYLSEKLQELLHDQTIALLFIDLDNFKYVNDSKGHEVGDSLLVKIARRMLDALGASAELIRFGGDEFIVLLPGISDTAMVKHTCTSLLDAFTDTFSVNDEQFYMTASIGIALAPRHATTASDLIKFADTAMYAAKRSGKNKFLFYDPSMDESVLELLRIGQKIREGIQQGFFKLYFQPLVGAASRKLTGFEALLRYENPEKECLLPSQFIPVAERMGEIANLSETVFIQASSFARELYEHTGVWIPISINLSARQFHEQSLLTRLKRCTQMHDIPAKALRLEVTESAIMRNLDNAGQELSAIRDAGFKIALDDFGTGYSSLAYLAKLPIDTLKIDQSFIHTLFDNPQNEHLVTAIITMARAMQMHITAEGIESNRQADFLLLHGADILQGHLFSEPLSAEDVLNNITAGALYFTPGDTDTIAI